MTAIGMCITAETAHEKLHLLIHHGVVDHQLVEVLRSRSLGRSPFEQ
jgi:hypothetical protein